MSYFINFDTSEVGLNVELIYRLPHASISFCLINALLQDHLLTKVLKFIKDECVDEVGRDISDR